MRAINVIGLLFGDEGKGKITDALVRKYNSKLVVRYNGGPQAAHNVVTDEGLHHTFAQLGSGMFNPDVKTYLGPSMVVDPLAFNIEADIFGEKVKEAIFHRIFVSRHSLISTPFHQALNKLRELSKGEGRHGSCGKGVGEVKKYVHDHPCSLAPAIRWAVNKSTIHHSLTNARDWMAAEALDLFTKETTTDEVKEIFNWFTWDIDDLVDQYHEFTKKVTVIGNHEAVLMFREEDAPVIFEGAQGVLLDEHHGFAPYNTWSDTTTHQALKLLPDEAEVETIGVMRSFMTRHGPGPLPTEDMHLTEWFQDKHNKTNDWQREFRIGHPDMVLLRYALRVAGKVDSLAITHLDWLAHYTEPKMAAAYKVEGKPFIPQKFKYFDVKDETVLSPEQYKQTENMMLAHPEYVECGPEMVLPSIRLATGLPISITTGGPKASEVNFR